MKETVEVVKCDLCGKIINTDNIPEDEYHYRYCISKYIDNTVETVLIEKDICPNCASKINKIYNGKHGEDINKYMDKYIEAVISELSSDCCKNYVLEADEKEIIVAPSQIRGIMRSILLYRDDFSNIFK